MQLLKTTLLLTATTALLSFTLPGNWELTGNGRECFETTTQKGAGTNGGDVLALWSTKQEQMKDKCGALAQVCRADEFRGRRIKMTASVKTENVERYAGLWLRVDGSKPRMDMLSFDNMSERPIKGTQDWKEYEIVLDVPENAGQLVYGVLLVETGKVWMDNIQVEAVDDDTPLTAFFNRGVWLRKPQAPSGKS